MVALEDPAPSPCTDLTVRELLEGLYLPKDEVSNVARDYMEAAAALIERLIGQKVRQ